MCSPKTFGETGVQEVVFTGLSYYRYAHYTNNPRKFHPVRVAPLKIDMETSTMENFMKIAV